MEDGAGARPEVAAWRSFVDALRDAGEQVAADTAALDPMEQADAYRSLLRALHNQLGRFEVDRPRPELVPFNEWRQRFFMDNPDFKYWVADIADDRAYRLTGRRGDAAYLSITVYAGRGTTAAEATSRIDSDGLTFDADGGYTLVLAPEDPGTGEPWLPLPAGASTLWVRHFHDDVARDEIGWCRIEPLEPPPTPAPIDVDRFPRQLARLGGAMAVVPAAWRAALAAEADRWNEVRHWAEMTGGAVYTEPGIHYLRGAWSLGPGEALVLEGDVAPCRYWNVLLYSRFLGSLDFRHRPVSYTGATASVADGRYRFVVSAEPPPAGAGDWLDTEGRPQGLVVLRWLQPEAEPALPTVTRCRVADL